MLRLFAMAVVCAIWAAVRWPSDYYPSIPRGTSYGKLSWIYSAMDAQKVNPETRVFLGSSICMNSVNDSLLNVLDTTNANYVNLGLPHTCFALVYEVLEEMVVQRGLKPQKVYLCLKANSMAVDIHKLYPLVADAGDMVQSIPEGNVYAVQSLFKRIAWNHHYLTRFYKYESMNALDTSHSDYGFRALLPRDSAAVEKHYTTYAADNSQHFDLIEGLNRGEREGWKWELQLAKVDVLDNAYFQRQSIRKSMALLTAMDIDFDVIMYPNLVLQRQGRKKVMEDYYHSIFPEIKAGGHELIVLDGDYLRNASYWNDLNHLNSRGANLFTRELLLRL